MNGEIRALMAGADSLERSGRTAAAADLYTQLGVDLYGTPEGAEASRRAIALDQRPDVIAYRKRAADLVAEEHARAAAFGEIVLKMQKGDTPKAQKIVDKIGIPELLHLKTDGDSLEKSYAKRMLAYEAAYLGYYEPKNFMDRKQGVQAATLLEVFAAIAPWSTEQCEVLDQARALMNEKARAAAPTCPAPAAKPAANGSR
jgi:hypothetical protein